MTTSAPYNIKINYLPDCLYEIDEIKISDVYFQHDRASTPAHTHSICEKISIIIKVLCKHIYNRHHFCIT